MSSPRIRCGVAGVGSLGQHHARIYASLPGAEQYKSSANPFSVAVINTPTLSLGATRTGIAVVFGAMQSGSSELSVGTGYSIPSSGGSFSVSGGNSLVSNMKAPLVRFEIFERFAKNFLAPISSRFEISNDRFG